MKSTTRMVALCAVASVMLAGPALADTSKMRIAFSNNYAGNSWRQAMLNSYDIVAKKAVADKSSPRPTSSPPPTRKCRPRRRRSRT